jgi:putative tricarboxylic transport membrane protein
MTASVLAQALAQVFDPYVLWVIFASALFGLFVGAVPGLTATMATALLVPVTFFMEPVPAIASIVTATAMAIFAGDIPSCLLRMPGTPASAAYTDEAYAMTRKGQGELALGAGLVFSVVGGLFGTAVLIVAAPALAEVALKFSSFEYFWLVVLGLLCAVFIAFSNPLKGIVSLLLGLLVASVGLDNPAGFPRFTFGNAELAGGLTLIPIMIGMFAISEVIRGVARIDEPWEMAQQRIGNVFRGMWGLAKRYRAPVLRGSVLGTAVGVLPGAGADIAAWMSYAASKKFSKEPEKFGTGHIEGIIEAGASNNSALAGAWVPALVFGIPGDSITAIVIGVLYIKGLNPGPSIFMNNPVAIYAIFIVFILANLLMLPLGVAAIKSAKQLLRAPREVLMPVILILGMVLGAMLEEHFIRAMIRADGNFIAFFERPIAGSLGAAALAVVLIPLLRRFFRSSAAK